MKTCIATILAAIALTLSAPSASAQEAGHGLGVGAPAMLTSPGFFSTGVSGASLTYDAGMFHVDGIFGMFSDGETGFGLGVQGWYVLHGGGVADLSVGGGLGFASDEDDNDGIDVHLDAGIKIRVFLVSNVALSAIVGLGFIFEDDDDDFNDDDDRAVITGQNLGSMGITYFF
jgi:hypothetical protein